MSDAIIWKPQAKQEEFLRRTEDEVLFGGSKGPGKTDALLMEATRQTDKKNYKALILRRTHTQLQEIVDRSKRYFPGMGASYNSQTHRWVFPSGAVIQFGSIPNKGDEYQYQGQEFPFIGFDQLEEFAENQYLFLIAQSRTSDASIRCYIRATANPGGGTTSKNQRYSPAIGHLWVRKYFIKGREPGKTYTETFKLPYPVNGKTELTRTRCFIPASVYDNPILLKANPQYLTTLLQLPEKLRKALLDGNWDVFEGQYFSEWDEKVHVIEPFDIPKEWKRYRGLDHGSFAPTACLWFALDFEGNLYCYREYYATPSQPEEKLASFHASRIKARSILPDKNPETIAVTFADPSMWSKSSTDGKSAQEFYQAEGIPLTPANNDRVNGWITVREHLKWEPGFAPKLRIFNTCSNLIRTLPELIHDETNPEDLNTDGEDHLADALRYFLVSRSRIPQRTKTEPPEGSFQAILKAHARKKAEQEPYLQ